MNEGLPVVLGNWNRSMVMLDFDEMSLDEVKYWCFLILNHFKLRGFAILESSRKEMKVTLPDFTYCFVRCNYLAVFDKSVSWERNVEIMNWASLVCHSESLSKYVVMQCIKRSSTLRLSSKGDKPPPQLIYQYGSIDGKVREFLETRELVLNILSSCSTSN